MNHGKRTVRRILTLLAAGAVAVVGWPAMEAAYAQKVANPGSFSLNVTGGELSIKTTAFDLTPNPLPQCSDGFDNEADSQAPLDGLIDYPADPQCASATDNSELAGGDQPKVDVSITGTVDGAGNVNVPTSGVVFPNAYMYDSTAGVITIQIIPSHAATGTLNPLTGAASIRVRVYIKLTNTAGGIFNLGGNCTIGSVSNPIDLNVLTTGTTAPPAPNTPISGTAYNAADGTATLVNNSFAVPGASNCGLFGAANSTINSTLGLPSAAGNNTAILSGSVTPVLGKAVNAAGTASPASGNTPLTVNFDSSASSATAGIANREWDLDGDGTFETTGTTAAHTYTSGGTTDVKLRITDTGGDSDTTTIPVVATGSGNTPPTASFTATPLSGVAPLVVDFDASASGDSDGSIVSYGWDFGDSSSGSGVSASHSYAVAGSYTVTLTVTDDDGATDTEQATVVVSAPNTPPTASFTATPLSGVAPLVVDFDASASGDSDGSIVSYGWDFGDSSSGSGVSASHSYAVAGSYTVTLTVTDDDGATDTEQATVVVTGNAPPTASFTATPSTGVAPLAVAVDASASADADGTIASYAWDFGDSGTGLGVSGSHTYTAAGTYTVTLTVTDDLGATASTTRTVTVLDSAANNKKVTYVTGVVTIPSTVAGQQATVAFDVRPFVFFGQTIFYHGKANYADPAANKSANGLALLGGNAIARYGLNGAKFTVFGFGPAFTSGSITYTVEDLSAIGGVDKVSVDASGALNYHNPGGDVITGNVTVLPAP
ncbi:MAG: PKD domain-containing protein [Acidimicrobiia bacterium]|nr:PKD domain-containing protein [Acidimicrobiia bacterium]